MTLLEKYEGLSTVEKRVLQVASLLFLTHDKSFLLGILLKSTLKDENGKELNATALNFIIQKLKREKFLDNYSNCKPEIVHTIADIALNDNKDNQDLIKHLVVFKNSYIPSYGENISNLRAIHLGVHLNKVDLFLDKEDLKNCSYLVVGITQVFYTASFEESWIKTKDPLIQAFLLASKLACFYSNISYMAPDLELWIRFYKENFLLKTKEHLPLYIQHCFFQIEMAMGVFNTSFKTNEDTFVDQECLGGNLFFQGEMISAVRAYEVSLKSFQKIFERREWFIGNINAIFYFLGLLSQENYKKALTVIQTLRKLDLHSLLPDVLETFLFLKQGNRKEAKESLKRGEENLKTDSMPLILSLLDWARDLMGEKDQGSKNVEETFLKEKFMAALKINSLMTAHLYAELLLKKNPEEEGVEEEVKNKREDNSAVSFLKTSPLKDFRFLSLIDTKESWEYEVDQLASLLISKKDVEGERRLVWLLDPEGRSLEIAEQKRKAKGGWNDGRSVSLKRLHSLDPALDYLNAHDKAAIVGLKPEVYGWNRSEFFSWNMRITLKALIGHPHIFHKSNKGIPLELVKGDLELTVEKIEKGYILSLSHHSNKPDVFLEKETANRYRVIDYPEEAVLISNIIPKKGLTLPFEAKEKLIDIVRRTKGSIKINSGVDEDIPQIKGDVTCSLHLLPLDGGLKANLWIRPFKDQGPYVHPGVGQKSLIANLEIEGKEVRQKALRRFEEEKKSVSHLRDHVSSLCNAMGNTNGNEFYFESLEESLELLSEIEVYKQEYPLYVEWPKGESLKINANLSFNNLSVNIRGEGHWFEYEGQVTFNNNQVLNMKELLDLLDSAPGRFIKLKDGEFLALKEGFRKQLEDLRVLSQGNRVYHLNAKVLEDLSKEAGETASDKGWQDHLKKLQSMEKHSPHVPSTLQATLRDYQEEGFKYLSRLSNWGIGACLADDMGLGKTLQAIALLLEQSSKGASLVVVPTSLSFTWREELRKFAPTLSPVLFHEVTNRKETIEGLTKRDILICSYGLLHQEGELLQKKTWEVVILDEAQSIKNKDTKRWQYATSLKSKIRIALTGTPIENHLGELWSLFHFLNPGLLGSFSSFQKKLWMPIEKSKDPVAKRALKALVSPYILRRTKSEVLLELPPKTEQTLLIEPSKEEEAFYEALRIKALERIEKLTDDSQKRLSVLSEITKLRQACCHSSLVDNSLNIESSKVKAFIEIIKNLKENNHKALVFSQYVGYLTKIREIVEGEGISYEYLDGSTPSKERQRVIESFQEGNSDLFLISLRAGGTGLNLTAADYVIILDPWWNPSVEDQASSRAHRMGQMRPVTVYRLIMKNTIEEKIIKLHQDKRALADDLLSDGHMSSKMTEEELLKLIAA